MKIILFLFLIFPTCLFSQWEVLSSTQQFPVNGAHIWATNESTVHIATDQSAYKSIDGGITWETQELRGIQLDITGLLRGIYFTSPQEGYIFGGLNGNQFGFWKTKDGGINWSLEIFPVEAAFGSFRAMQFVNTTGFLIGDSGAFYKTTDNGNSWRPITNNIFEERDLIALNFLDELTGFVLINNGRGYKTIDGGNTWIAIEHPVYSYELGLRFFDEQNGVAWGKRDGIYTTKDGGNTWERIMQALGQPESMWWFSEKEWIVLLSDGKCYKTVDGGTHWALQNQATETRGDELFFVNDNMGWITVQSKENNILRTKNGGGLALQATLEKEGDCVGDTLYLTSTTDEATHSYWKLGAEIYTEESSFTYVPDAKKEYTFTLVAASENQQLEQSITFTPSSNPINSNLIFDTEYDTICEKSSLLLELNGMEFNSLHRIAANGSFLTAELYASNRQAQWEIETLDTTTLFTLYTEDYSCGLVEQKSKKITVVKPPNENVFFTLARNTVCKRDDAIIQLENPEQGVGYQVFSNEIEQSNRSIADNNTSHSLLVSNVLATTTYKMEASKSSGCVVNLADSLDLTVIQLEPTFAVPSLNLPINEAIQIQNTSADSLTFDWQFGNGTVDTKQQPAPVTFSAIGTVNIGLEVTSPYGCKETKTTEITTYDPADLSETWISKHSVFNERDKVETFSMNVDTEENIYFVVNKYRDGLPYSLQTQSGKAFSLNASDQFLIKNNKLGVLQWAAQIGTTSEATFSVGNLSFKPNKDIVVPISYNGVIFIKGADGKICESPANTGFIIAQFNPNGALINTILIESYETPFNCSYFDCFRINTVQVGETGALFLTGNIHLNQDKPEFYYTVGSGVRNTYDALDLEPRFSNNLIQFVAKINPNNEIAWIKPYNLSLNFRYDPYTLSPVVIQPDKAGGLYIWSSGKAKEGNANFLHHVVALTRLDNQGEKLWDSFGTTIGEFMFANYMEVDKNGDAIIAGSVVGNHRMGDYQNIQTTNGNFFGKVSKEGSVKWMNYIHSSSGKGSINNSYNNMAWGLSLNQDLLYLRSAVGHNAPYRTFPVCNKTDQGAEMIGSIWDLNGNALQFYPMKSFEWRWNDNTKRPQTFTAKNQQLYFMGFSGEDNPGLIGNYSIPDHSFGNAYAARIPDNQKYLPYITRPADNIADCHLQVCENNLQPLEISSVFTDIQWLLDGQTITGATSTVYTPVISGNYTVQATNPFGERVNTPEPTSVAVHLNSVIALYQIEDHLTSFLDLDFYIWRDANTHQIVHSGTAETGSKFYPEAPGAYYLQGDLWGYCLEASETFEYEGLISTTNETALGGLEWTIFPNPSEAFVYVRFNAPKKEAYWEVSVYNKLGKKIISQQIDHQNEGMQFQFDGSGLPAGVYSVQITGANQLQSGTERVVIVK